MDDGDDSNDSKDDSKKGRLLVFPGGKSASTGDIGTDYVVGQGGHISMPELVDPQATQRELRERDNSVQNNDLVKVVVNRASPVEAMDAVVKEIVYELAHLKFEREKAAREGKNTANYNMSRIAGLRQIADVLMKRSENTRAEQLDLKSPRFKAVLRLWMEYVYECAVKAHISEAEIELMFGQMKADMADWEQKILTVQE